MEISINGKLADIVLEKEEKVGDVLSGLENWLQGSGNRISGLAIDGLNISAEQVPEALAYKLSAHKAMDITIISWSELAIEALVQLKETCLHYNNSSFIEYSAIRKQWEESAAATFLYSEIREFHELAGLCFAGEGVSASNLLLFAEERIRELGDPERELENMEKPVSEIARRMEELPLDVQTGKDGKAAETIQFFTQMAEKLFRLLRVLKLRKPDFDSCQVEGLGIREFLNGFNTALGELTSAYKNQDAVLIGDLAEYEMAPRLLKLYSALKNFFPAEVQK
ncbi:MAG: hypothetical protein LBI14_08990 [Treponema sp.]|jgi:hypothetical protein|nr:hypothetical protein [Treponema sp.]